MKNKKLIIAALVFGLLTSYLIYDYLTDIQKKLSNTQMEKVVIAATAIPAKALLTPDMLKEISMPTEYIHPQALRKVEEGVGRISTVALAQGEQLLQHKASAPGNTKSGLAYAVPNGRRAMAIPVDDVSGLSGMILPGDRVDVVAVLNIPLPSGPPHSVVVLQDIQVLAVNNKLEQTGSVTPEQGKTQEAPAAKRTVILAVTVEKARSLALSTSKGVFRLILRSPVDKGTLYVTPFKAENYLN